MRITDLTLKNIRVFGDDLPTVDFSTGKNATIFLGDNGCGKTTILDSISLLISPFISQFPGMADKNTTDDDVHYDREGRQSDYLEIKAHFLTGTGATISETRTRRGGEKAPDGELKEIKQYALNLKDAIEAGDKDIRLPVFAYYGTGRGNINAPERKRNFQKNFARWDCYKNALTPSTDFKSFFAWFDLMEDEERRERERRRDFDYKLPALEAVRRALRNFVGEKYHSPRIELHPLRFVMTEDGVCMDRTLRIEQLSDGYKIIIAMVADIASRMAEANPSMPDPLQTGGIILIDEIDLHLHPQWQRKVVEELTTTFPNIQFILTSHSPIIISGAADKAQIIHLNNEGPYDAVELRQDLTKMNIGQILLSEMFGLSSLRAPVWDKKIERQELLLSKTELTTQERQELDGLNRELSALYIGNTPSELATNKLLKEIAQHLGIIK